MGGCGCVFYSPNFACEKGFLLALFVSCASLGTQTRPPDVAQPAAGAAAGAAAGLPRDVSRAASPMKTDEKQMKTNEKPMKINENQ